MTREILESQDGGSFILDYEGQLTQLERQQVLNDIGCPNCGTVAALATCTSTQKQATQTVTLSASPTNGQPPYVVKFFKGPTTGTLLYTSSPISAGGNISYIYVLTGADVGAAVQFSTLVTDSCSPPQTSTESCNVTVITSICSYISNIGGKTAITAANISALVTNYATGSLGFYSRAVDIQGALLWYAGASGNAVTGCNF